MVLRQVQDTDKLRDYYTAAFGFRLVHTVTTMMYYHEMETSAAEWWSHNNTFGGSKKRTGGKIVLGGRSKCIYEGRQGGLYVKDGGRFVSLRTIKGKGK